MAKDPAVLFYINDWLTSTSEMDADCRGWYLNLLLHNYDKKSLPNDVEKLAVLCNVKFSEYQRFEQVFEQVLKHKFEHVEENRISNLRTDTILRNREIFTNKRSEAGKMSYVMKYMAKNYTKEYKDFDTKEYLKTKFDLNIDLKNEQVLKQMFKQVFELYRNENESNIDIVLSIEERKLKFKESIRDIGKDYDKKTLTEFFEYWTESNNGALKFRKEMEKTFDISMRLKRWKNNNFNIKTNSNDKLKEQADKGRASGIKF